jgi:putative FmdB family regulatory protein
MPIYEYRCSACGHQEDHLLKLSDAALTKCPACGKKKYEKQLTAAGFQLKGSGWYASDFKGGGKKPEETKPEATAEAKTETKSESKTETKTESRKSDSGKTESKKTESKTETKAEKKTPASTTN